MSIIHEDLHEAILNAHDAGDGAALAQFYEQASQLSLEAGRFDESCFFLTQAYVFAMEEGLSQAQSHARELRRRQRL